MLKIRCSIWFLGEPAIDPCLIKARSYGYNDPDFNWEASILELNDKRVNAFGSDFLEGERRGISVMIFDPESCTVLVSY